MKFRAKIFAAGDEPIEQFELEAANLPEATFLAAVEMRDEPDGRKVEVEEAA